MTLAAWSPSRRNHDAASTASSSAREPALRGTTVVVIGASAGIGLETARGARAEGPRLILTARNKERLERAASELGPLHIATFDATDAAALERFFRDLAPPIDHVLLTAGRPHYGRLVDLELAQGVASSRSTSWAKWGDLPSCFCMAGLTIFIPTSTSRRC